MMSSSIFIIRGEKASIWGSVYLDEFGEEDIDLRSVIICRLKYGNSIVALNCKLDLYARLKRKRNFRTTRPQLIPIQSFKGEMHTIDHNAEKAL